VLGSTGSIGTQTLETAKHLGLRVIALATASNITMLERQIRQFEPVIAGVLDEEKAETLARRVADTRTRVIPGEYGVLAASTFECDTMVNAIVGSAGLQYTIAAIEEGHNVALANKETLVCAGQRVMELARQRKVKIIPIDSEHTAIMQCLNGEEAGNIRRVLLTASGGPFRGMTREQMKSVTMKQTLSHPNWAMGAKITVDSATMMNKGFEYIEAMRLYDLTADQIEILVHPQSIMHSAVEFKDGSVIAQMSSIDMRLSIQYALTYPERVPSLTEPLDLSKIGSLTFEKPDLDAFPCLKLAMRCAGEGDAVCETLSNANDSAVARFLNGEITYYDIFNEIRLNVPLRDGE